MNENINGVGEYVNLGPLLQVYSVEITVFCWYPVLAKPCTLSNEYTQHAKSEKNIAYYVTRVILLENTCRNKYFIMDVYSMAIQMNGCTNNR